MFKKKKKLFEKFILYILKKFTSLTKVSILSSLNSICQCAFDSCKSFTHIRLSVIARHLQRLVIPSKVIVIQGKSFSGCLSLLSISIPPLVRSVGIWRRSPNQLQWSQKELRNGSGYKNCQRDVQSCLFAF